MFVFNNPKNYIKCKVNEKYQSGKDFLVDFSIGGQNLRGYVDADYSPEVGSEIEIGLKENGDVFLFNEETGAKY